jgi:hypothetical protein
MSLWTGVSCGSFQSHGEMAFFLAWMGSRPSSFSDDEFSGGGGIDGEHKGLHGLQCNFIFF